MRAELAPEGILIARVGARETGAPRPEPRRRPGVTVHPDLAEALAAAEDTLSAALGREVRVRARQHGCRVEFDLDSPGEAVALAERILAAGGRAAA